MLLVLVLRVWRKPVALHVNALIVFSSFTVFSRKT